jgi:hypothetical protein
MYDWQGYAQAYQGISDANYVLYTERKNLVLGTDINNFQNQFDAWFDKTEDKLKAKIKFYLGFNYKFNELMAVAY